MLLVCLQLSMASYACPVSAGSGTAVMARMAGMPDCDRTSRGQRATAALLMHCDRDKQTVNSVPAVYFTPAGAPDRMSNRLALWLPPEAAEALPAVVAAHNDPPDGATAGLPLLSGSPQLTLMVPPPPGGALTSRSHP